MNSLVHPAGRHGGNGVGDRNVPLRLRLRVIKGHTVIYHGPESPIPNSMSPFLYQKTTKTFTFPWGGNGYTCYTCYTCYTYNTYNTYNTR